MAKIRRYGTGGSSTTIEAYTPTTPYYWESDNVPLINLTNNDESINQEISSMVHKYPVETPNGTLNEFTLPNNEQAVTGSLIVNLNGVQYDPRNILLLEGGYKFRITNGDIIPDADDNFFIMYRTSDHTKRLADSTEVTSIYSSIVEVEVIENISDGDGLATTFNGVLNNLPQMGSLYFSNGEVEPGESGFESGKESGNDVETFWETGTYVDESGYTSEMIDSGWESGQLIGNLISDEGGTGWINYATGEFELNFASAPESGEAVRGRYVV